MYLGLDAAEKKFGQGKVDPAKQRGMNEKITDGARGMFEKATGTWLSLCNLCPNDRTIRGVVVSER